MNTRTTERWIDSIQAGNIVADLLLNDFHRPIKNRKCNREKIEDNIIDGIQAGVLPPMTVADVNFICDVIDEALKTS